MEEKNDGLGVDLNTMSIDALRASQPGFEELQALFKKCGELFDRGDDRGGMGALSSELMPKLLEFANFLAAFMGGSLGEISPELRTEFSSKCDAYQDVLKNLLAEMEKKNLTEVGDILRFDLADLVTAISHLFPRLADDLESKKK